MTVSETRAKRGIQGFVALGLLDSTRKALSIFCARQAGADWGVCLTALRVALAAAWLGPEAGRPEADTLRKLLSAACSHSDDAVRSAATSAIPAIMASVSRLAATGLSQVIPKALKP
jgi:hypothetical protein